MKKYFLNICKRYLFYEDLWKKDIIFMFFIIVFLDNDNKLFYWLGFFISKIIVK